MITKNKNGFSFISLLLGIAILAILLVSAFLWIDPVARLNAGEDTKRVHDVNIIAAALSDYMQNNQGKLPFSSIVSTTTKKILCSQAGTLNCAGTASSCIPILDTDFYDDYLAQLPTDPDKTSTIDTGYYLLYSSTTSQLEVGSCAYNNDPVIIEPQIFINSSVYYEEVVGEGGRAACGGVDYADHCWYYADATNKNCNTVCADNGLTCESGVDYNATDCTLNLMFTGSCAIACFAANDPTYQDWPPSNYSAMAICGYRSDPVGCAVIETGYYSICPCE